MDITARHFTSHGSPLLAAAETAAMVGVKTRTVYQWKRRGFLAVRGLDEDGRELYDATEAAMVASRPGRRKAA